MPFGQRYTVVRQAEIKPNMGVSDLMSEMSGCALGAGRLAEAVEIYEEMIREKATKFFGLAGALVPVGMRKIISGLIRDGYIDVLVTTGANIVHDVIEALGGKHYRLMERIDDAILRKEGINRIFDVVLPEEYFAKVEEHIMGLFGDLDRRISIRELVYEIGRSLDDGDSILRSAVDCGVPIFCPAIADSMIGLNAWLYKQNGHLNVDAFDDLRELIDICYEAKRTGAVILGGGVPKNFILQSMLVTPKGFDYFIQLTMDRPETGGLSGATPDEAKSWGKIKDEGRAVTVYADATIVLPIIVAALRSRLE